MGGRNFDRLCVLGEGRSPGGLHSPSPASLTREGGRGGVDRVDFARGAGGGRVGSRSNRGASLVDFYPLRSGVCFVVWACLRGVRAWGQRRGAARRTPPAVAAPEGQA